MTNADFKKGIQRALAPTGFTKAGKLNCYAGKGVVVLLALQKLEHDQQFFLNVGFWLTRFGASPPERVELSHLYFRVERLFPEYREIILCAGKLDDEAQPSAFNQFVELLRTTIAGGLVEMADELRLRQAFREGRFEHGLIRKEVREVL